ncbi:MAG: DNA repair protein RecO, partial [Oscillospiraceae bacterium]|nr:DNA repair protein RecO [Oscillospiraceae bacterium]
MHFNTRGLVLREIAYKDRDKLLTVLTPDHGKLTVRARGLGKRGNHLDAAAQLLVYSDMTLFSYRDYYTLDEANSIRQFWGVKSDLELLALASYFAELT